MRQWWGDWSEWRRELAAAVALGLFLGVIGPFGTFSNGGGLTLRIAYWVGILVVGVLLFGLGTRAALAIGQRWRQPMWFVLPVAIALLSLPMSLITSAAVLALWPNVRFYMRPFDWYAQALVMGSPLVGAAIWSRRLLSPKAPPAPVSKDVRSGAVLLDRLPPRLGRRLVCLQMEDHYVRVHTAEGSELILMPLKAAATEVGAVDGMQVHRSWWVARDAVVAAVPVGRGLKLRLINGVEAPVSRSAVAQLRARGWLATGERDASLPDPDLPA